MKFNEKAGDSDERNRHFGHYLMSGQDNDMPTRISERMMIQYLLGELPEAWQARFEELFFTDSEIFTQLQIVEERLIDDYVRGQLLSEQREGFETRYLISERRQQKVAFARTLIQAVAELPSPTNHGTKYQHQTPLPWRERPAALRLAFLGLASVDPDRRPMVSP
ncbi:MAG: hypothetical protein IPM55_16395 [Acidobacteria bacterium]|nr:hypothetical protein [Acidobacteriota bacterium]